MLHVELQVAAALAHLLQLRVACSQRLGLLRRAPCGPGLLLGKLAAATAELVRQVGYLVRCRGQLLLLELPEPRA